MTPATSPAMNLATDRMSTSAECGLFSAMFQRLFQLRIVERQQRPLFQLPEKRREPDSTQSHRRGHVEPVQLKAGQPEQVHDPHTNQPYGYGRHPFPVALELPG